MQQQIEQAYEGFQFHQIYQRIHQFCVTDMGGFYLDILKDRLYTTRKTSQARLSAQTAMQHILESLVRSLAPILSFTAEEVWEHMSGAREDSVLFATRYSEFDALPEDADADQFWQTVINVRDEVSKQIENVRVAGDIGAALDANVSLYANDSLLNLLQRLENELRFVLITSDAEVLPLDQAPASAVESDMAGLKIAVIPSTAEKCVRCWHRRPEVGRIAAHPELCERCVENVDGTGERRIFA